jgi:hypothetical protein
MPTKTPGDTVSESPANTPTAIGTGSNPMDVVVSNQTGEPRTLTVHVSGRGTSETVFDRTLTLESSGRQGWDIFSRSDTGVYIVKVRLGDGTEQSYEWDLDDEPEEGWVYISLNEDGSVDITYAIA